MLVAAILIFALMVAVKDGRVLRNTGLTGGCRAVATPAGDDGAWHACDRGKLQGAPGLTRQGCKSAKVVGKTESLALPRCDREQQPDPVWLARPDLHSEQPWQSGPDSCG
ncbi:MAG: hypothetical protein QOH23_250 [Gaiellaceae bacterium]|nr:hypothetical protein [Gaiellaceae bacterium]